MENARTQAQALAVLREGRPVSYRGYEIPAPPEGQRSHRKARAWLLERSHVEPGRPSVGDERVDVVLPADHLEAIDRHAEARDATRQDVVRELVADALALPAWQETDGE